jgi:WD40 repeat protein
VLIFDTAGNQVAELTPPAGGIIDRIAWNSDGNLIAFNTEGRLHVWSFALNQYLTSPTDSFQFGASLHFSATVNQLAFVSYGGDPDSEVIVIWDTDTSQEVGQLVGHEGIIYTFDWEADRIATVGLDDTIRIWDTQTFEQLSVYGRGSILHAQLSPTADSLLTSGPDNGTFQILDPETGQIMTTNYVNDMTEPMPCSNYP